MSEVDFPLTELSMDHMLVCDIVLQIGALSVGRSRDNSPQLLISQPGGTYVTLTCRQQESEVEKEAGKTLKLVAGYKGC